MAALWAAACLGSVGVAFWIEDWRYALPTEVPDDHRAVEVGAQPGLPADLGSVVRDGVPVVLHFFNPDCPCSRFNLDHLRRLVAAHEGAVDFVLVHQLDADRTEPPRVAGLDLPAVDDSAGRIADHFGVYATPTAVVLDADRHIAYTGNYSASRYCVDPAREYVRLALGRLLDPSDTSPRVAAPTPYGCALPSDLASAEPSFP